MSVLTIRLLGKLAVQSDAKDPVNLDSRKVQELLCYLLLHRARAHSREVLSGLLWRDGDSAQSKAYLRKSLWKLCSSLEPFAVQQPFVILDDDWVQINSKADLWIDVAVLERAYAAVRGMPGDELDGQQIEILREAVDLYRGDLLEGWYTDWCLFERDRFQQMYLAILGKLMTYCEKNAQFEAGVLYGTRLLACEPAHESTHLRLMRLHYLAGDRTAALRQFERCCAELRREFGVEPDGETIAFYHHIRSGQTVDDIATRPSLSDVLAHLRAFKATLAEFEHLVEQDIKTVEQSLSTS